METTPAGAPGAIRELPFVRGHLAEICVGDDAALTHYARAFRAGFLPAGLRATQVIEDRRAVVQTPSEHPAKGSPRTSDDIRGDGSS